MQRDPAQDTRNVIDKYKGQSHEAIVADLNATRIPLEIAVENLTRDFNMGTIVRTANAFNVRTVHIIGSRQWNKRGAMKTDAYLTLMYHKTAEDFFQSMQSADKTVIALDIVKGARPLHEVSLPENCVMVFGAEGPGLSDAVLKSAHEVAFIEQFGSTRSINVGVAAGIAMYAWVQKNILS